MSDSEEETKPTIEDETVLNKFKMCAEISSNALKFAVGKCIDGASCRQICIDTDAFIMTETAKVFKREKDMKKGIAFPTCVNVNNIIVHFSPLKSETDIIIKDGDVVKINVGVHLDGFPIVGGHTVVVGASTDNKVTGRKADTILAAHYIAEAAHRLIKNDADNMKVSEVANTISAEFKCKPLEGIQSHTMSQNEYRDEKTIVWLPSEELKRSTSEKCTIEKFDVWNVNVVVSSGEGKPKETDYRCTVFRKNNILYQLKMKASRQFIYEAQNRFGLFPFTLRAWDDEKVVKAGVIECRKHDLVEAMPVYKEKEGEVVACFQFTLLVLAKGALKVGGIPLDLETLQSDYEIKDESIKEILSQTVDTSNKAKKKKKKSAKPSGDAKAVKVK